MPGPVETVSGLVPLVGKNIFIVINYSICVIVIYDIGNFHESHDSIIELVILEIVSLRGLLLISNPIMNTITRLANSNC